MDEGGLTKFHSWIAEELLPIDGYWEKRISFLRGYSPREATDTPVGGSVPMPWEAMLSGFGGVLEKHMKLEGKVVRRLKEKFQGRQWVVDCIKTHVHYGILKSWKNYKNLKNQTQWETKDINHGISASFWKFYSKKTYNNVWFYKVIWTEAIL